VKEGKGKKDRYIPLADILIRGLKSYLAAEQPNEWEFNSKDQDCRSRRRRFLFQIFQAWRALGSQRSQEEGRHRQTAVRPPKAILKYFNRYTQKVSISNHRILDIDTQKITLSYKDYRQGAQKMVMSLDNLEFIRDSRCITCPEYRDFNQRPVTNPALRPKSFRD
jgi:hypothetical protein